MAQDCINEILEYLEEDKITLQSCLLINRLWCEVTVRILWRKIRNYDTLIDCLPKESKEILYKNGITLKSRPLIFNYVSFCKFISIYDINYNIKRFLNKQQIDLTNNNIHILISQEIFKLLMSQISSLKKLKINNLSLKQNTIFISYPGAKDCLKNLTELYCDSDIYPEFFYQLSQICHNIKTLYISINDIISDGLTDLISIQKNLKCLNIWQFYSRVELKNNNLLSKIPNTLIKLNIHEGNHYIPLSFIAKFTNIQELMLSFRKSDSFGDFKKLQYITFSKLQSLEFRHKCPKNELLIKFLENNGKNLKEFYIIKSNYSLNLAISKYCPNLRKLSTGLTNNDLVILKMFFNSCQYLESIKICCKGYFSEYKLFKIISKYSPKNFNELKLVYSYGTQSILLPDELESFLIDWSNRIPQKSLSLITIGSNYLNIIDDNKKIIDKYIKLGIIKKF
ncbi:hypothetical protein C1645_831368 [Glomus cerebriforme]|uniref:F-box domain-containing protein n=1 Tax=Glomus cerebriforme TaxID=658196 RepID=A0A397SGA2_9GLOM|nr:hypothetical protein C1645_831368 [Glomus cerebriforme]